MHGLRLQPEPRVVLLALAVEGQVDFVDLAESIRGNPRVQLQLPEHEPEEVLVERRQHAEEPRHLAELLALEARGLALVLPSAHNLVSHGLAEHVVWHAALREGAQGAHDLHWPKLLHARGDDLGGGPEEVDVHEAHLREDREQGRELRRAEGPVPGERRAANAREELVVNLADGHKGRKAAVQLVGPQLHEPGRHLHRGRIEEVLRELRKVIASVGGPQEKCAHEQGKLRAGELLKLAREHAAQLRDEVPMVLANHAAHLVEQLRELLWGQRVEFLQNCPPNVLYVLRRPCRLHAPLERVPLGVGKPPLLWHCCQRGRHHCAVNLGGLVGRLLGRLHLLSRDRLLGLLHVALETLQHLLHSKVVFLRLRCRLSETDARETHRHWRWRPGNGHLFDLHRLPHVAGRENVCGARGHGRHGRLWVCQVGRQLPQQMPHLCRRPLSEVARQWRHGNELLGHGLGLIPPARNIVESLGLGCRVSHFRLPLLPLLVLRGHLRQSRQRIPVESLGSPRVAPTGVIWAVLAALARAPHVPVLRVTPRVVLVEVVVHGRCCVLRGHHHGVHEPVRLWLGNARRAWGQC
mmetsp:Transcript_35528/g.101483  ORF Transcript_35528/g.101483 Transcript_35528/m.101483 type:complete len:580 (+) Transcript_35528:834-2573(+)